MSAEPVGGMVAVEAVAVAAKPIGLLPGGGDQVSRLHADADDTVTDRDTSLPVVHFLVWFVSCQTGDAVAMAVSLGPSRAIKVCCQPCKPR